MESVTIIPEKLGIPPFPGHFLLGMEFLGHKSWPFIWPFPIVRMWFSPTLFSPLKILKQMFRDSRET